MPDPLQSKPVEPQPSLSPTTTSEEDLKTAGQRNINLIWEWTQAIVAIGVIGSYVSSILIGKGSSELALLAGSIVTFYFVRTNHTKTGGIGGTDSR